MCAMLGLIRSVVNSRPRFFYVVPARASLRQVGKAAVIIWLVSICIQLYLARKYAGSAAIWQEGDFLLDVVFVGPAFMSLCLLYRHIARFGFLLKVPEQSSDLPKRKSNICCTYAKSVSFITDVAAYFVTLKQTFLSWFGPRGRLLWLKLLILEAFEVYVQIKACNSLSGYNYL